MEKFQGLEVGIPIKENQKPGGFQQFLQNLNQKGQAGGES